jgi:hypothetical protein
MGASLKAVTALSTIGVVAVAVMAGTIAGRQRSDAELRQERGPLALELGTELPRAAVINDSGLGVDLTSVLDAQVPTIIIMFNTGCQSCLGQIDAWGALAKRAGVRRSFLGLVCAPDLSSLAQLKATSGRVMKMWFCDSKLRYDLHMVASPTIYEVLPNSRIITFRAVGDSATTELSDHLSRSGFEAAAVGTMRP